MPEREVNKLIRRLLTEPLEDYIHQQTVKIPEKSHHRLMALAQITQQTKSELAAALLTAAIDDAIDALPADDIIGIHQPDRPFLLKDVILSIASESYREYLEKHGRPYRGGDNVRIVDVDGDPVRLEIADENRDWSKKRLLVFVPEINDKTFLLLFNKGKTGNSYSLREYPSSGGVVTTYAQDYPYTADQILKMAKYIEIAPAHPVTDHAFWFEKIAGLNKDRLSS